jgi:Domain of unknown function (DUF362)
MRGRSKVGARPSPAAVRGATICAGPPSMPSPEPTSPLTSRRRLLLAAGGALAGVAGLAFAARKRLVTRLSQWTRLDEFTRTPDLVPHDPARDRRTLYVARGGSPAENVDAVFAKMGGVEPLVGPDDVVLIKVSAQWWNQGMTNVAAVKRVIERVLGREGFRGEVVVFENVHFRLADGSGLARAWTRPSERNVDVPGWTKMGDLLPHFAKLGAPVSFVGLVDAGESTLAGDHWHDPTHEHGVYGGDGRGPIAPGDPRDGYHWSFDQAFRLRRSRVDHAQTPLTWPRFTASRTGTVVDLRDGAFRREGGRLVSLGRQVKWINMTTTNEHSATGYTGACKSAMGVVDMSAGRMGTHPRVRDYQSVHYFGDPDARWRMAGPLAHFAKAVRAPDLYLSVAEWVALTPRPGWDEEKEDIRMSESSAFRTKTIVAGTDPVAVDAWCVRNLLMPLGGANRAMLDLDDPDSKVSKFLRYYRQAYGSGTLDSGLVEVA